LGYYIAGRVGIPIRPTAYIYAREGNVIVDAIPYLAGGSAVAALALAAYFFNVVKAADPGNEIMLVLIAVLLNPLSAVSYLIGAVLSAAAGWAGMTVATMANARTTNAAIEGPQVALPLAFKGGAVMGFSVAGLSLLGLSVLYILFVGIADLPERITQGSEETSLNERISAITAFGLGASSIALFSRVGGGIYTKAADVGADLVGKVEAGIPEDDPRNPATIADNVGDNVGDVAGMGADLFESYSGSIIAPMAFTAFAVQSGWDPTNAGTFDLILFPFVVAFVGMIASIIGSFTVRSSGSSEIKDLSHALHMGTNVAMGITVAAVFVGGFLVFEDNARWAIPLAVIFGLIAGWMIGKVAEIWTSDAYGPVKEIAKQSETGPATVILKGISSGMISVGASVTLIAAAVGAAYWSGQQALGDTEQAGIYGVAIAAIGMLATTGVVVGVDAYGPIADNAGGIAEMAELPPEVREVTDSLDSLGNTTAAVAKGFAVGSAALTALALFASFDQAITAEGGALDLDIGNVEVFIGLFLGAMLPFVFAALTIDAVGRAAAAMIEEVRRQFREIPGLREGKPGVEPDSATCVAISTEASLKEMIIPGGLAVVVPLVIGFISVNALGGFLAGALVSGFALAIYMSNAGGAWDNAKKYIETGAHGGKGSDQHAAAVIGDTVGDPFKDTSGPAMNILIKVMTIVSLIFASAFV